MVHSLLIVDDDPTTRYVLSRFLASAGYRTATAENGAVAVRRIVEARPCVILLDLEMPIMDGRDFREVQKRIAPDVPIICISGPAEASGAGELVGASRVHPKPLDVWALCGSIADLCASAHGHREETHTPSPAGRAVTRLPVEVPAPAWRSSNRAR